MHGVGGLTRFALSTGVIIQKLGRISRIGGLWGGGVD